MGLKETAQLPVMLYDGDCGFCKRRVKEWKKMTGDHVRYEDYRAVLHDFPQLTQKQCQEAVWLVMPDGMIYSGAKAVFKALDHAGKYRWLLRCYERVPGFGWASERFYQLIAGHRSFL